MAKKKTAELPPATTIPAAPMPPPELPGVPATELAIALNPSQRRYTPTLNELTSEMLDILHQIDVEAESGGGEISPELEERLQAIESELPTKIDGYVYVIRELLAYSDECKHESQRLAARAKAWDNKATWLKGRILNTMQAIGETKIKTARNTVSVCKNGGALSLILPEDQSQIPDAYLTSKTVIEPDREKIKQVLLALDKYKAREATGADGIVYVQLEPELLMELLTKDYGPDIAEIAFQILQAEGSDGKLAFASFAERGCHLKIS